MAIRLTTAVRPHGTPGLTQDSPPRVPPRHRITPGHVWTQLSPAQQQHVLRILVTVCHSLATSALARLPHPEVPNDPR